MALFGSKKPEKPSTVPAADVEPAPQPASQVREAGAPASATPSPRVGIDHAIQLMRSLPTDKNVHLVVSVLKTTLESLGIRVVDIVADASKRQKDLEGRVAQLKSEIQALEQEVDRRTQEIVRLESAHAETTKVKGYLEGEEIDLVDDASRPNG